MNGTVERPTAIHCQGNTSRSDDAKLAITENANELTNIHKYGDIVLANFLIPFQQLRANRRSVRSFNGIVEHPLENESVSAK